MTRLLYSITKYGLLCFTSTISFDKWRYLEMIMSIFNIIAIIIIPIVAVIVGQWLQERAEKRKDKMQAFKILMTSRIYGWWTPEPVNVLNTIDIVFADDKCVRKAWKLLYDIYTGAKSTQPNSEQQRAQEIQDAQYRLLEAIAKSLGYKDKITWETIQSPYYPKGLSNQIENDTYMRHAYYNAISNVNEVVEKQKQQSNTSTIVLPGMGKKDISSLEK